jgi:formylglycine-generating enzyme required for sulfatase activity
MLLPPLRLLARLALAALILVALATSALAQGRRVALVIGIDSYGGGGAGQLAPLRTAVADARALRDTLRGLGFTIIGTPQQTENVTREQMEGVLAEFSRQARGAAVAMISFHGHGVAGQARESFLLPRDFPTDALGDRNLLRRRGFAVEELADVLERTQAERKILLADACRDQVFTGNAEALARSTGLTRGLEPVDTSVDGLMVIYSADHGRVAYDRLSTSDPNPNGVMMRHFLPQLRTPGISVIQAVERANRDVRAATRGLPRGEQRLALRMHGGEFSDLMLAGGVRIAPAPAPAPAPQPPVAGGSGYPVAVGQSFRDCTECPELAVIPPGRFVMGSLGDEPGRHADEGPQREVTVGAALAVGKYEVTFAEWDACVAGGGCQHRPGDQGWGRGRQPVIDVSWNDAQQYVRWLSQRTGQRYRLLTEAEWEYAARAGTSTRYSFGDWISPSQANYFDPGLGSYSRTRAVGSYAANRFGLHDMHGNVLEWVEDCYVASYSGAPGNAAVPVTFGHCSERVLRGGSWNYPPQYLRPANRGWYSPGDRFNLIGFRVARTPG